MPRSRRVRRLAWSGLALLLLLPLVGWLAVRFVPLPPALFVPLAPARELTDRHGRSLREVTAGPLIAHPAALAEYPPCLIEATLAAEDRRFWTHGGVDGRGSLRALAQWLRYRRVVSGGSTITQQLIKIVQPRPRTLGPKLLEIVQALRLERTWPKQRILLEYLNRLDYGNRRQGSAAAAAYYFGRALRDLSPAEAAFLAGLPQAPSRLNPHRHFERARQRQLWVLERLHATGWLTEEEYAIARATPLRLRPPTPDFLAPHFADLLLQTQSASLASHAGGPVRTSLDLDMQRLAERSLRAQLERLRPHRVQQGAVVVLEVLTGEVRALVGSPDYLALPAGQVNGAWARRSAGSTLKPFTYLIALEEGATAASVVADLPTEFATPTGVFAPVNFDRRYHGPVRYRLALANSLNVPAVKVLDDLGGAAVLQERLVACGLTTLDQPADFYGLGLTIGNAEVRLLELANAYACLARLGQYRPYELLPPPAVPATVPGAVRQVFPPGAAWLIADILRDNAARALAFGLDSPLHFGFPVACKTGTSSSFRDNWAFGYTPEFVVGVWVGNFDGSPMQGVSGISGAAPILRELLTHLHEQHGTSWYASPPDVRVLPIHALTGQQLPPGHPEAVQEWFLPGTLPAPADPADFDAAGRIRLPVEYRDWFALGQHGLHDRAWVSTSSVPATAPGLRITQPVAGAVYVLDPDLPEAGRRLRLRAVASGAVVWQSATLTIHHAAGRAEAWLTEGRHELVARDPDTGAEARTWIEVRRL